MATRRVESRRRMLRHTRILGCAQQPDTPMAKLTLGQKCLSVRILRVTSQMCLLSLMMFFGGCFGPDRNVHRRVAITIDDLPRGGHVPKDCEIASLRAVTNKLLGAFTSRHVPVIGFVNEGRCPNWKSSDLLSVLDLWLKAGADLGTIRIHMPTLTQCRWMNTRPIS
jgi:hypothetical protein